MAHSQVTTNKDQPLDFQFAGFKNLNSTPIPDEFFDLLAVQLSEAELRVLLYIMRRTFGFKKTSDAISLSQLTDGIRKRDGSVLDHGTGLSKPSVLKAVSGLQAKGIIAIEKRTGYDGRNEVNVYSLRFQEGTGQTPSGNTFPCPPPYSSTEYYQDEQTLFPTPDPQFVSAQSASPTRRSNSTTEQRRSGAATGAGYGRQGKLTNPPTPADERGVNLLNRQGKGSLPPTEVEANRGKEALPGWSGIVNEGSQFRSTKGVKMLNQQHDSLQTFRNQETVQQPLLRATGALALQASPEVEPVEVEIDGDLLYINFRKLVTALVELGLSQATATQLAYDHPEEYLWEKIELTRHQIARSSHQRTVRNTAGYLRRAIEEDYQPQTRSSSRVAPAARFPQALALVQSSDRPADPDSFENTTEDTAPLPPIYRTARPDPANPVTPPEKVLTGHNGRPAWPSQPSGGAEGSEPTSLYSPPIFAPAAIVSSKEVAPPQVGWETPQGLYAELWEQIQEDLVGRYRLGNVLNLLEGSWLWLTDEPCQATIVLASPWQERELGTAVRSAVGMAVRQRLGPGYRLCFEVG